MAGWSSMLIHLPGGTALHLQQLRPALIFICLSIIFNVLQEKEREKMNKEVGTVQVGKVAKAAARFGVGDTATGACLLQTGG